MSDPVGIMYCIDSLNRAGTELQLAGLIERLDRRYFKPHLCTIRPTEFEFVPTDCPHLELNVPKLRGRNSLASFGRLVWYLRHHRISILQTYFQDSTLFAGPASWVARVPVRLASFRDLGFWRDGSQETHLRRIYTLFTGFVANSEAVKQHFSQSDGIQSDEIKVIPNGIAVQNYPFVEHDEPVPAVGIVGNLNRLVKRTDLFLEAAARVAGNHPDVQWYIIGDGPMRSSLEEQARSLGLYEKMVFTGRVADVSSYLAKLAIGVNCSDSEGFSNAVIEYMLRGCSVVATAVGGNMEAIQDGQTGLLVATGDAAALAEAIDRLITDAVLRRHLANNARTYAVEHFNWNHCVQAHQQMYESFFEQVQPPTGKESC